ncbi:MAG: T9SS type A sorting domain-containing protein [Bacteroidia bacterium]
MKIATFHLQHVTVKKKWLRSLKLLIITAFISICSTTNAQNATGRCTVLKQVCNKDGELSVTITAGMTPPLTFTYRDASWSNAIVHKNINALTDVLTAIASPIYTVEVVDSKGGRYSNSTIGMVDPFTIDQFVLTAAVCPNLGTAKVTINGGGSPVSVEWFKDGISYATGNPINLPGGSYGTLITDSKGCTTLSDSSAFINNISPVKFSVTTTKANCTNGTATVADLIGGTPPYTYKWSNGATTPTLNNLMKGNYDVLVMDAQGCTNKQGSYIEQETNLDINHTVTPATCLENDGSVITFATGGTPPYTYSYSNGSTQQTAGGLKGGVSIFITVVDAKGCTNESYSYISSSSPVSVKYTTSQSSCTTPTGSATLTIKGGQEPYTIEWLGLSKQTGITLSNVLPGVYAFKITDANGCRAEGSVNITSNSYLYGTLSAIDPVCPIDKGNITADIYGQNPPFTYLWNNGATSQNLMNTPLGDYSCIVTDNVGCSVSKTISLTQTSALKLGISNTSVSCIYEADGTATVSPTGGTAPYTYHWDNGQNTFTASNLKNKGYSVNVTDANNCSSSGYTYINYDETNTNCYCTITGKVYVDLNNNCIYDAGEKGISNIMIHCSNFGYSFTDNDGSYSFKVPTGNYIISENVKATYPLATCQSNSKSISVTAAAGCINTVNFANKMEALHDLSIVRTSITAAVPGNTYLHNLIITNNGTLDESTIGLGYKHDGQLNHGSTSPIKYTQLNSTDAPNWYSVLAGFPILLPGESQVIRTESYVPTNIPLATIVNFWDTTAASSPMKNWLTDYTPWNNVINHKVAIVSSFDPNFVEVTPKGEGPVGNITINDFLLNYVIHFQNTGTYYAQNIVVIDTLDPNLEWESLHLGYSDHRYEASLTENGILTFTFKNINLNWRSNNDLRSRGLVSYAIKPKAKLSIGTQLKSVAGIYFDYNAPVITNQTINTITKPLGIKEISKENFDMYPNPSHSELNIGLNNISSINVYDLQGRLMKKELVTAGTTLKKLNIEELVNGLYLIELEKMDGTRVVKKFIKN